MVQETPSYQPDRAIFPVFRVRETHPVQPLSCEGTGFLLPKNVFVTCWHCVGAELPTGEYYAAVVKNDSGGYTALRLFNLQQDVNGNDLATALVNYTPEFKMTLADAPALMGTDVLTYGYPLTTVRPSPEHAGTINFALNDRFLQGYIMRSFYYEHSQYGQVASYELDMPAPAGLSGAPLIELGSTTVIGVIYGTNDVGTIEEFSQVDPETGKRTPEVVRVTSFALAHHTETLRNLRRAATEGLPLAEYLAT